MKMEEIFPVSDINNIGEKLLRHRRHPASTSCCSLLASAELTNHDEFFKVIHWLVYKGISHCRLYTMETAERDQSPFHI
jgi:hypothetical protein